MGMTFTLEQMREVAVKDMQAARAAGTFTSTWNSADAYREKQKGVKADDGRTVRITPNAEKIIRLVARGINTPEAVGPHLGLNSSEALRRMSHISRKEWNPLLTRIGTDDGKRAYGLSDRGRDALSQLGGAA